MAANFSHAGAFIFGQSKKQQKKMNRPKINIRRLIAGKIIFCRLKTKGKRQRNNSRHKIIAAARKNRQPQKEMKKKENKLPIFSVADFSIQNK